MKDHSGPVALVILDVQDAIDRPNWDGKNNPEYLPVIQRLLNHWRSNGWPVLHVKHDEQTPTSSYYVHGPWNGIKKDVAPIKGETVITKQENCAFIGTELDAILKRMQVKRLVLTGGCHSQQHGCHGSCRKSTRIQHHSSLRRNDSRARHRGAWKVVGRCNRSRINLIYTR